jgi:hypothetical protein
MLEQQLQIAQDFREQYHWINELRNIRKGKEDSRLEFKEEELAANLRLELKDVRIMLRMLDLIDAFLIWKDIPGEYDYPKLDKAEEVFRQLEKAVKKYAKDHTKRDVLQKAVFNLIEERPSETRLYKHVGDLIKNFDQIYTKIKNTFQATTKLNKNDTGGGGKELLDELLEPDENNASTMFDDPKIASENSATLIDIIADVNAENKEKRDTEAVYESVSAALRELQGLTIENDTAKTGSIKNKLEQIISASERLLDELKEFNDQ